MAEPHGVVVLGAVLEVPEDAVVDEAGGVVEVVVARVDALRPELQLVRRAAVHDRAVAQLVGGHPRHDHRRAVLVAKRDVHLQAGQARPGHQAD